MRHGSLFSGIGGFDLAAHWMGWENVFHCEWNPFGQRVLKYYFPNAISYNDIVHTDFTIHRGNIDLITGGFPCQPYSNAGKRKGKEDERHLFPQMLRAITEIQPRWVVGENVFGLVNWSGGLVFHEVQSDLEAAGYEVFPYVLAAASVNAPHVRQRVFFIAHSISNHDRGAERGVNGEKKKDESRNGKEYDTSWEFSGTDQRDATDSECSRLERCKVRTEMGGSQGEMGRKGSESANATQADGKISNSTNSNGNRLERGISSIINRQVSGEYKHDEKRIPTYRQGIQFQNFPTQSPVCDGNDGIPSQLDSITFSQWRKQSIMAGGNAVVPPLILQIFKTIQEYELRYNH